MINVLLFEKYKRKVLNEWLTFLAEVFRIQFDGLKLNHIYDFFLFQCINISEIIRDTKLAKPENVHMNIN